MSWLRAARHSSTRTSGHLGAQVSGHPGIQTSRHPDIQAAGPPCFQAPRHPGFRTLWLPDQCKPPAGFQAHLHSRVETEHPDFAEFWPFFRRYNTFPWTINRSEALLPLPQPRICQLWQQPRQQIHLSRISSSTTVTR